ncbi:Ig-like domain repeat protein [Methanobrevibacter sp.]|uniref:Ig-like domain-containing protein n=1 Tax=Methanobrevibacter sp. TaxID=66852 RepID=UPI0026E113B4|nr:Ig-like domain repeat protein [Methanobrevibacter sp.]MDO5823391.1 Ig-like domain-containing protein [Methanobrevibacter sp.]
MSEAENTAHGFASVIGGINITGNTVKKADSSVDGAGVTFYYIKVLETLGISPVEAISVKDNDFSDIPDIESFKIEFAQMHIDNGTVYIPQAKTATKMAVTYVKDGRVVIELAGIDDRVIENAKITYAINGGAKIIDTTDQFGHIYINGLAGVCDIEAKYAGSNIYGDSSIETTIQMGSVQSATKITAGTLTVYAANAKGTKYRFTLKDGQGNVIANQDVSITFNGKVYNLKTDGNGAASFILPTNASGKYDVAMAFTGTASYKGSVAASTITVQKQATKLTVAKKTFKKKTTKKITATLKDNNGKALSGKKVTLKVNGKTYKATTNKKGVATFTVKITKKGTFTATTSFSGDLLYSAKTVKSKIKVK